MTQRKALLLTRLVAHTYRTLLPVPVWVLYVAEADKLPALRIALAFMYLAPKITTRGAFGRELRDSISSLCLRKAV